MRVPALPPELWAHIAHHLLPESLSALSEVNKTLNTICTNPDLFQRLVPTSAHPVQRFRRICALSYPPPTHSSIRMTATLRILCTFKGHLLLHDITYGRLIAFPSGVIVDVVRLVGEPPVTHDGLFERSVILPGDIISFVSCIKFKRARLTIWNVVTGDLTVQDIIGGLRAFSKHVISNKFAAVAGDDAEAIIYYVDDDNIVVVEWATGKVVTQFSAALVRRPLLLGECSAVPGMPVVGLVSENASAVMREIICKPFNGPTYAFRTTSRKRCQSVLRSLDKQTFVAILYMWTLTERKTEFVARRTAHDLGEISWEGTLPMYTTPELTDNGRVIVATYGFEKSMSDLLGIVNSQLLEVVLCDDGTTKRIGMRKRDDWKPVIWYLRGMDQAFAVTAQRNKGLVELFKLDGEDGDICVKSWSIKERFVDASVVAEHFIVATCEHGRLFVWHFDKFCNGAKGPYACPGLIPDAFLM